MEFLKRLRKLIFGHTNKAKSNLIQEKIAPKVIDKVSNFNQYAPNIFGPRLHDLGYNFNEIENFEQAGFLWSTHHYYRNENLHLTVDIQQAPYYTDYGFSIFLLSHDHKNSKLLCNVPHELQDEEGNFLISICDKFFSNEEVISLLKGGIWKEIKCIQLD